MVRKSTPLFVIVTGMAIVLAGVLFQGCEPKFPFDCSSDEDCNSQAYCHQDVCVDMSYAIDINGKSTLLSRFTNYDDQVRSGRLAVVDDGATLKLTGSSWNKVELSYAVTPNTILEFDFEGSTNGEIYAIGLDEDNIFANQPRTFQVYGTNSLKESYQQYHDYIGSGARHHKIPIGQYYIGQTNYLVLVSGGDGLVESRYKNIRLYEARLFEQNGIASMEAEHYTALHAGIGSAANSTWSMEVDDQGESSGGFYMKAVPDSDVSDDGSNGPRMDYSVQLQTVGIYHIWVRIRGGKGNSDKSDSVRLGVDGTIITTGGMGVSSLGNWTWLNRDIGVGGGKIAQFEVSGPETRTISVWMREDGVEVDKVVVQLADLPAPVDMGPDETRE